MKQTSLLLLLALTTACAGHRDVRPGPQGLNQVSINGQDATRLSRSALDQANSYCEDLGKRVVVLKEEKKYIGTVDEKTYNATKMAARGAKQASWEARVASGAARNQTADIMRGAASTADATLGDGYNVTMDFRCE